ncbi:hypothetical protein [Streptomyces silvisoli]|uniref:Uncharacterized protein n=1 Tax=Streptomyces silvisoli TaxID=3034235 RepID=A0ABT5ZX22_9ACTN|nr:hypothetical protein [Streptomyces silvisoli]MDF3294379.1 hypothetical protein [Streptomyces silvisoli]
MWQGPTDPRRRRPRAAPGATSTRFAATYQGGTSLAANQREITFTTPAEQRSQGGRITAFEKKFRILDRDPFYVIA